MECILKRLKHREEIAGRPDSEVSDAIIKKMAKQLIADGYLRFWKSNGEIEAEIDIADDTLRVPAWGRELWDPYSGEATGAEAIWRKSK
jgi:hypothetical protein